MLNSISADMTLNKSPLGSSAHCLVASPPDSLAEGPVHFAMAKRHCLQAIKYSIAAVDQNGIYLCMWDVPGFAYFYAINCRRSQHVDCAEYLWIKTKYSMSGRCKLCIIFMFWARDGSKDQDAELLR